MLGVGGHVRKKQTGCEGIITIVKLQVEDICLGYTVVCCFSVKCDQGWNFSILFFVSVFSISWHNWKEEDQNILGLLWSNFLL